MFWSEEAAKYKYDELFACDGLTIRGRFVGSPANFKGKFSDDRNTISGR